MLQQYMTNNLQIKDFHRFNDELLYLDRLDLRHNFETIIVDADVAYKHEGNFYGLLKDLGVQSKHYLYALYLNKLNHPSDYRPSLRVLKKPLDLNIPKK